MFRNNKSSTAAENETIRNRYAAFVQQHHELYNDKIEALTQEDIDDIEKRKRSLKRKWFICCAIVGPLALASLIVDYNNFGLVTDVLMVLIIVIGLGAILVRHFNNALKSKEKRVINGVVTAKIKVAKLFDNTTYLLELSSKQKIRISSADFKKCEVGEIIRIEMFTDDIYIKRKIVKLGKI